MSKNFEQMHEGAPETLEFIRIHHSLAPSPQSGSLGFVWC